MDWLLPAHISDRLPEEADTLETLRGDVLQLFQRHGYDLVAPPHIEFLDALLTGVGSRLRLETFKLVDQMSGRTLGLRADISPQVARIDAHRLNQSSINRLCYCGSVFRTVPDSVIGQREFVQIGAELYGYADLEADFEVLNLALDVLAVAKITDAHVVLAHKALWQALITRYHHLGDDVLSELAHVLQHKNVTQLALLHAQARIDHQLWRILSDLIELDGDIAALAHAQTLLHDWSLETMFSDLTTLSTRLNDHGIRVAYDLTDLQRFAYHSGVVFSIYSPMLPSAELVRGGRYDGVGATFGRDRPATGFSLDLGRLVELTPARTKALPILAPALTTDRTLDTAINALRDTGVAVVRALPQQQPEELSQFTRRLSLVEGRWQVIDHSSV